MKRGYYGLIRCSNFYFCFCLQAVAQQRLLLSAQSESILLGACRRARKKSIIVHTTIFNLLSRSYLDALKNYNILCLIVLFFFFFPCTNLGTKKSVLWL